LGARRFALVADVTVYRQQAGDLLACAWPAPLCAAARPLESVTWLAALAVITVRCCGQPSRVRKMGYERFLAAVRRERSVRAASTCGTRSRGAFGRRWPMPAAQRRCALELLHLLLEEGRALCARLADCEPRMTAALYDLGLSGLVTSIDGLGRVSGAVMLAETGT
jgi:transposase